MHTQPPTSSTLNPLATGSIQRRCLCTALNTGVDVTLISVRYLNRLNQVAVKIKCFIITYSLHNMLFSVADTEAAT